MFDIPEAAIAAFERIHGIHVTVHDLVGTLWGVLSPERFKHRHPLCVAVKASPVGGDCFELEVTKLRRELPTMPGGRVHICHAGLVEWAVPVFHADGLAWVLFAGPRTQASSLALVHRMGTWRGGEKPWSAATVMPEAVDAARAEDILEHLRQLAARLSAWAADAYRARDGKPLSGDRFSDDATLRSTAIRQFIAMEHRSPVKLSDLSDRLGLSESRTSHLVREACGATFQEMLVAARIRTAMGLLRTSTMSVVAVAQYSGFQDLAHFHRSFRRATGMSPGRYRAAAEA